MTRLNLSEPRFGVGFVPLSFVPRVVLLTAIHGRHDLAKRMLKHSLILAQQLAPVCSFRTLAVMSHGDVGEMGAFCDEHGIAWLETANLPLSNKWQRGLTVLSQEHSAFDMLMLSGSDDFISYTYAWWAIRLVASGQSSACGPDWVYLYNAQDGRMARFEGPTMLYDGKPAPVGAGRVFSKALLVRIGWRLWPDERDEALDGLCTQWLSNLGYDFNTLRIDAKPGAAVVDVKDGQNIHGWERFTEKALVYAPDDADALLRQWQLYRAVKGEAV